MNLPRPGASRPGRWWGAAVAATVLALAGACGSEVPEALRPDPVLREELGLTDADEVHRVLLSAATGERARPDSVAVPDGAWVDFVSADFRVHEIVFEVDSLAPPARAFLERTDQVASPPLVDRGARFVIHMEGAPPGRYPYLLQGNGAPVRGVVVVLANP